jgi:hypothetical protein
VTGSALRALGSGVALATDLRRQQDSLGEVSHLGRLFIGGGGCREATADEAVEYLSWSPRWAHLMRLTLEMGWHDVHRALVKL